MENTPTNKMIGKTPVTKSGKKEVKKTSKKKGKKKGEKKELTYSVKKPGEVVEEKTDDKDHGKAVEIIKEVVVQNPGGLSELKLDAGKIQLLKNTIAMGATDDELKMFINVCTGMGLSPFLKQIHMVKRWNSKLGREVASIQVGIDGFRSIAENTGAYAGNDDPVMGEDIEVGDKFKFTAPSKATVTVYKMVQGAKCEFTATARWTEFYPGDKIGFMWKKMPNVMLGKCAEAQALRKAFPKVLGGVYAPEEMDQAGEKGSKEPKDPMRVAITLINREKKVGELIDFEERIKKSTAYTKEQKDELVKAIKLRASVIENEEQQNA